MSYTYTYTLQIQKEHRTSSTPHFFHSLSRAAVLIASSRIMAFRASCISPRSDGSWRTRSVFWRSGRKRTPKGTRVTARSHLHVSRTPSHGPATQHVSSVLWPQSLSIHVCRRFLDFEWFYHLAESMKRRMQPHAVLVRLVCHRTCLILETRCCSR